MSVTSFRQVISYPINPQPPNLLTLLAASSLEGGEHDGVQPHKSCIFWRQNQLGGNLFRSYSSSAHFNLQSGQPYIIRVVPGCTGITKRSPLPHQLGNFNIVQARQATTQLAQSNSSWIQDPTPGVQNGTGYILVPIAGAQAGEYNLHLGLTGFVQHVAITDGDGTQYALYVFPSQCFGFSGGVLMICRQLVTRHRRIMQLIRSMLEI